MLPDGNEFKDMFSATQKSSSIIVNQTYSYINNTGFYALANPTYFNYYYRFARRYAWWYDRYVPDFHNAQQGYFSTGIAHAIVDSIANLIVGRKLLLQNAGKEHDTTVANKSLKAGYKWTKQVDFTGKARALTKYAGALGTSALKTNIGRNSELWIEPLRFDDFFFKCDFRGELTDFVCLIKSYADTLPRQAFSESYGEDLKQSLIGKYYLVEHRYYKTLKEIVNGVLITHEVPFVKYQVHKYNGNITNAQSWNMSLNETIRADSLPKEIRQAIGKDYSVFMLDQEQRLPFEDLGVDLYRYNGQDCTLSQQPFGQSILADIISDVMDYEIAFAYAFRDMYQGKGTVFMAKELQTALSGNNAYQGLEDTLITLVNSWQENGKLPLEQVQFNLRVSEWREKRNECYESIAMKLSISPSSLASFLSDNTARTAKEISTESGATDNYIEIQRGDLETVLNKCLARVGKFYGWEDEVEVRFAKIGSQNLDTIIDRVIKLTSAGLMHPYDALRQIMVDADEYEVKEAYDRLQAYNQEREQQQANSMFGMDFNETNIGKNE